MTDKEQTIEQKKAGELVDMFYDIINPNEMYDISFKEAVPLAIALCQSHIEEVKNVVIYTYNSTQRKERKTRKEFWQSVKRILEEEY